MEAKVFAETLAPSALVLLAKSRVVPGIIVPNFKSSGAKFAKSKATELATGAFTLQTRIKATGHLSAGYEPKRSKHQRQESDEPSTTYEQPRCQQEGRQSQAELEHKSIGSTCEEFPKLEEITRHLIVVLRETSKPDLKYFMDYIHKFGNPEDLCNILLDYINPEIRELEGKPVTHGLLENIRRSQKSDEDIFHRVGGYLDHLTDN